MSTLTKLFVVLLVICSLLLTAATVVFVNRTEDYRKTADLHLARASQLEREVEAAKAQAAAAEAREQSMTVEMNGRLTKAQQQIGELKQALNRAASDLSEAKAKGNVDQATITQLATALKTVQQNLGDLQKRNDTLLADADKLRNRNAELTASNTSLEMEKQAIDRELRWQLEQVKQLTGDLSRARNVMADRGINFDSAQQPRPAAAPDIKGTIKEVQVKNGQAFATITVGSADRVERGMQFNVINQDTMEFLGKLVVDAVEQNEAFGRLEGPRVQDIRPDYQVRTQL